MFIQFSFKNIFKNINLFLDKLFSPKRVFLIGFVLLLLVITLSVGAAAPREVGICEHTLCEWSRSNFDGRVSDTVFKVPQGGFIQLADGTIIKYHATRGEYGYIELWGAKDAAHDTCFQFPKPAGPPSPGAVHVIAEHPAFMNGITCTP